MQILAHVSDSFDQVRFTRLCAEAQLTPLILTKGALENGGYILGQPEAQGKVLALAGVVDALDRVQSLRGSGRVTPILVLEQERDSAVVTRLLRAGADDVMSDPLDPEELSARVGALVRRASGHARDLVEVGEVQAFLDGRDPVVAGVPVELTRREQDILQVLALNAGRMVTKDSLFQRLYGLDDNPPLSKVVEVHVCTLRKKLAAATGSGWNYIETVKRRGYRLTAPG